MTTIAWDGTTLVADTLGNWADMKFSITKAWKLKDGSIMAGAGNFQEIMAFKLWIESGQKLENFPKPDERYTVLLVRKGQKAQRFETSPYPITVEEPFTAIGSGRDYALGAMAAGADAKQAVEIAKMFDVNTGGELTELRL